VRFKLRTIMATVAVIAFISGGYLWLLRNEPALNQEFILRSVKARMAEADLARAQALHHLAEIELQNATTQSSPGDSERSSINALRAQLDAARFEEAAATLRRDRARAAEWRFSWLLRFVRLVVWRMD
jgi:hypothetical protein